MTKVKSAAGVVMHLLATECLLSVSTGFDHTRRQQLSETKLKSGN